MNILHARTSRGPIAAIAGLVFALLFTGLEMLSEDPGATQSISIWHTPLLWLLASTLIYLVLYAGGTLRAGRVRERKVTFGPSVAAAVLLALYWLFPMLAGMIRGLSGNGS